MSEFVTATFTVGPVAAGGSLIYATAIGHNQARIFKTKIVPIGGSGTFDHGYYKRATCVAADVVEAWQAVPTSPGLFDPMESAGGGPTERNEGEPIFYEDLDAGGNIHGKITNNDAGSRSFTVSITYQIGETTDFVLIEGAAPTLRFSQTGAPTDERYWQMSYGSHSHLFQLVNDALSVGATFMLVNRSGNTVSSVVFPSGQVGIGGTPFARLTVLGSTGDVWLETDNATPSIGFLDTRVGGHQYTIRNGLSGVGFLDFRDDTAARIVMSIDPSGFVGIGAAPRSMRLAIKDAPSAPSYIVAQIASAATLGAFIHFTDDASTNYAIGVNPATGDFAWWRDRYPGTGGTQSLRLTEATGQLLHSSGSAALPPISFMSEPDKGLWDRGAHDIGVALAGTDYFTFNPSFFGSVVPGWPLSFGNRAFIVDIGANVLGQFNGDNSQELRIYGALTGSKYLTFTHDGTNGSINTSVGNIVFSPAGGSLLPITDGTKALGSTNNRWSIGVFSAYLSVGTNPAGAGSFRLPNNGLIFARNAANSADYAIGGIDVSNNTFFGDPATPIYLRGSATSFFSVTAVGQQTAAALANNVTAGGTNEQVDDWSSLTVYATDAAAIRNAMYQVARKVSQLTTGLRNFGLFV